MTGRSPDFILKAMNKATENRSGKIGAAWLNENGSITLVLDIAVLPDPNTVYTLFPNDRDTAFPSAAEVGTPPAKRRAKKKPTMSDLPVSVAHDPFGRQQ